VLFAGAIESGFGQLIEQAYSGPLGCSEAPPVRPAYS
jgi:hypothetical protein